MNLSFVKINKGVKLYSVGFANTIPVYSFLDKNKAIEYKKYISQVAINLVITTYILNKDVVYISKIVPKETLNNPQAIQKKAIFLIQVTPNIVALGFSDTSLLSYYNDSISERTLNELIKTTIALKNLTKLQEQATQEANKSGSIYSKEYALLKRLNKQEADIYLSLKDYLNTLSIDEKARLNDLSPNLYELISKTVAGGFPQFIWELRLSQLIDAIREISIVR